MSWKRLNIEYSQISKQPGLYRKPISGPDTKILLPWFQLHASPPSPLLLLNFRLQREAKEEEDGE